jgi:hypothetical protein
MLEACIPGQLAGCNLIAGAASGSFDACTSEGVAGGSTLAGISTGAYLTQLWIL